MSLKNWSNNVSLGLISLLVVGGCASLGNADKAADNAIPPTLAPSHLPESSAQVRGADYSLNPIFERNALTGVTVTLSFTGDADGETVVILPSEFAGQQDLWKHISGISLNGATLANEINQADGSPRGNGLLLRHAPSAPVRLTYKVASTYDAAPTADAKGGAAIRSDWMSAFGEALFASIDGRDKAPARFALKDWPANWHFTSDLEQGDLTQETVMESTVLAGPRVEEITRPITNGTLHFAMLGKFDFTAAQMADQLATVLSAQRSFWGDEQGPFTVTLYELGTMSGASSASGTGRSDGFALEATGDMPLAFFTRFIAHEHNHSWIPYQMGEPGADRGRHDYWITEGFTEFYTPRTLLAAGLWNEKQYIDDLNDMLLVYSGSSVRTAPNARIVADFWNDPEVEKLPYQRGWMFALMVDGLLRSASGGTHDFDDLVKNMQHRWKEAPVDAKPQIRDNFIAASAQLGLNVRPLIARYIDQGQPIDFKPEIFGDCGRIETVSLPKFDPGFDRAASAQTGIISGVSEGSSAWRAGLRNGMKRISHVASKDGDARVPVSYRISDTKGERVLTWLPQGKDYSKVLQFKRGKGAGSAMCQRMFGGTEE